MRALLRRFDAFLCRLEGIFAFSDREDCLLRLQITRAPHDLRFPDSLVKQGETVLALHLWNEHLPVLPPEGGDLTWASRIRRLFLRSLREVAGQLGTDPRLAGVRAVGGNTALFTPDSRDGGARFMKRLGFMVLPYRSLSGRFGEFWENLYSRWLIWAYNPVSLRGRWLSRLRRSEMWMPAGEFARRYGQKGAGGNGDAGHPERG